LGNRIGFELYFKRIFVSLSRIPIKPFAIKPVVLQRGGNGAGLTVYVDLAAKAGYPCNDIKARFAPKRWQRCPAD
jgi:hypothetical protein